MTYPYTDQSGYQQGPPQGQQYGPPPGQGYQQGPPQGGQWGQPQYGPPPQQGGQWGPPPQGGGQWGGPPQGQQQGPPPAIPGTLDAFYSQPSTGGGVPWSFEHLNTEYFGIVRRPLTDGDTEQQYTLGQNPVPATFKDGRPKLVLRIPLNVPKTQDNPEGAAQWYCRSTTRDQLAAAMAQVGAPAGPPEVGAGIYVKFVGTKRSGQGMNPSKVYDVRYWRPDQAAAIAQQLGIEQPAPGQAAPAAQVPAQAPVEQQAPQGPPPQQYAPQGPAQGQYVPPGAQPQGPPPQQQGQPSYPDPAAAQGPPPQQGGQWGPPPGAEQPQGGPPPPPPVQWQAPNGAPPATPGYVPQPTQQQGPPQGAPPQGDGGLLGSLTGR